MAAENGADGYHVSSVHWNYVATVSRRATQESTNDTGVLDVGKWGRGGGSFWSYPHGHLCLWTWAANPESRPHWDNRADYQRRFGDARGDFMVRGARNLCIYPNLYLMDQMSTQIRHSRPISVDKTEVTIYCVAPKGESPESRALRIRQYEDFFNATGMATPDDLEEFRACQMSYRATAARWNDLSRGVTHQITGPDEVARELGMSGIISSGVRNEDEGHLSNQHRYWLDCMRVARRRAVEYTDAAGGQQ